MFKSGPISIVVLMAFIAIGLPCASASLNPEKAISQYVHDVWTTANGLPQNDVLALAQTPDGFIWLGTEGGLIRFDGVEFRTFNEENEPVFHSNEIDSLMVDKKGVLWIGSRGGGLVRLETAAFRPIPILFDCHPARWKQSTKPPMGTFG